MKKILYVFLCVISVFSLSGCNKADELGKNSIVSVIFADFKNNTYTISAEASIFSDAKDEKTSFFSGTGNTPAIAWENLRTKFPYSPYFGHVSAIILESGFFEKNLKEVLTFLISENSISPNSALYITKCNPFDFEPLLVSQMAIKKILPVSEMYTFFTPINYHSDIPVLKCKNKTPYCENSALFTNLSYTVQTEEKDFFVYSLLKNKKYQKSFKTFDITESKAKLKTKNNKLEIKLDIFLKSVVPISEKTAEDLLKNEIDKFISKLIKENKTHILTNEAFKDYNCKIRISLKENSKLKGK